MVETLYCNYLLNLWFDSRVNNCIKHYKNILKFPKIQKWIGIGECKEKPT